MIFNVVLRFLHSKYQASLAWDSNPQNKHAAFKYIQDRSYRVSTKLYKQTGDETIPCLLFIFSCLLI